MVVVLDTLRNGGSIGRCTGVEPALAGQLVALVAAAYEGVSLSILVALQLVLTTVLLAMASFIGQTLVSTLVMEASVIFWNVCNMYVQSFESFDSKCSFLGFTEILVPVLVVVFLVVDLVVVYYLSASILLITISKQSRMFDICLFLLFSKWILCSNTNICES